MVIKRRLSNSYKMREWARIFARSPQARSPRPPGGGGASEQVARTMDLHPSLSESTHSTLNSSPVYHFIILHIIISHSILVTAHVLGILKQQTTNNKQRPPQEKTGLAYNA